VCTRVSVCARVSVVLLCCGFLSRFLLLNGMKRNSPAFSKEKSNTSVFYLAIEQ
jgi:hypothetical protein